MTPNRRTVLPLLLAAIAFSHQNSYYSQANEDPAQGDAEPPDWPLFDPSAKIIDVTAGVLKVHTRELLRERGTNPTLWQEVGTRNGVSFSLGFEGSKTSGLVAGEPGLPREKMFVGNSWRVQCSVDLMTDRLSCVVDRMVKLQPVLRLWYKANEWSVCIGEHQFPGTPVQIRLDSGPFRETTSEGGCFDSQASKETMTQMKTAGSIRARFMKWPYRSWILLETTSYGLKEILEMAEWFVRLGQPAP